MENLLSKNNGNFTLSENKSVLALSSIMSISGFFHDNGKSINGFQTMLADSVNEKKSQLNAIRHELVSAVLLLPLFKENDSGQSGFSRIDTLEKVKNYFNVEIKDFYQEFISQAENYNKLIAHKLKNEDLQVSKKDVINETFPILHDLMAFNGWYENPLLQSLLFLVLSHHKLPNSELVSESMPGLSRRKKKEKKYFKPLMDSYFKPEAHPEIRKFLAISSNPPWEDLEWCSAVANAAGKAIYYEKIIPAIDIEKDSEWSSLLLFMARPSLILSDYKESSEKEVCKKQQPESIVYANTINYEEKNVWADTLVDHQLKVGNHSTWLYENLAMRSDSIYKNAPVIKKENKPFSLMGPNTLPERSPFYWQNKISETLKNKSISQGFFGVLMSKTGAGKTKGAPQIMMSLSDDSRFNIALGMRTLTLQTYNAYISKLIGLKESHVSMMIGQGGLIEQDIDDSKGSGNDFSENDFNYECTGGIGEYDNHPLLSIISKDKQKKMLMSPVSVMTIDHIIEATNQSKGVNTTLLLEIMTSDLILDEIDDYSTEDLIVVSKLIFLCGFYGRKVIISSATSSMTMIKSLEKSYLNGYKNYSDRTNSKEPDIAYMSHESPYISFADKKNKDLIYDDFIENLCIKTNNEKKRHKAEIININKDSLNEDILSGCLTLADRYCEVSKEGIEVSIGFVRFSNVKSSMDFAEFILSQNNKDRIIKVQNYHSRMDKLTRYSLESRLNIILNRSNNEDLFSHEEISSAVSEALNTNMKKITVIVSTTSIQETGRDHDYDWLICEPSSDKSLIQCSGRTWRHRREKSLDNGPNVGVLSVPIKSFYNQGKCWSYPGIESEQNNKYDRSYSVNINPNSVIFDALNKINIKFVANKEKEHVFEAKNAISAVLINDSISANPSISKVINYSENRISSVEQAKMHYLLGDNDDIDDMGVKTYLSRTDLMLTNLHDNVRSFRKRPKNAVQLKVGMKDPLHGFHDSKWFALDDLGTQVNLNVVSNDDIDDKNIFIKIDRDEALKLICSQFKNNQQWFAEDLCSINIMQYGDKEYEYSTFYGFKEKL